MGDRSLSLPPGDTPQLHSEYAASGSVFCALGNMGVLLVSIGFWGGISSYCKHITGSNGIPLPGYHYSLVRPLFYGVKHGGSRKSEAGARKTKATYGSRWVVVKIMVPFWVP